MGTLRHQIFHWRVWHNLTKSEQLNTILMQALNAMEVREDDEEFQNPVDLMFEALEKKKPNHFAVRQYKKYKLAAGDVCSK